MTQRQYSLKELDQMRMSLRCLLTKSRAPHNPAEKNAEIEDQLRTHMLNGTDPEILKDAATQKRAIDSERDKHIRKYMEERSAELQKLRDKDAEEAKSLQLCDGLEAERSREPYRCDKCYTMQQAESWLVLVPEGVLDLDSASSITERCRSTRWNGTQSGWCLKCAQPLGKDTSQAGSRISAPSRWFLRRR